MSMSERRKELERKIEAGEKTVEDLRRELGELEQLEGRILLAWSERIHDLSCFRCIAADENNSESPCNYRREKRDWLGKLGTGQKSPDFDFWQEQATKLFKIVDGNKISMAVLIDLTEILETRGR